MQIKRFFSTKNIIIKNENLSFQTNNYIIKLFPFHPQVYKKNKNTYIISKESNILSMIFLAKEDTLLKDTQYAWSNRKSFAFHFADLIKLLNIKPYSGKQTELIKIIKKDQNYQSKQLHLHDYPLQEEVHMQLIKKQRLVDATFENVQNIKAIMKYPQYTIMHHLLYQSIPDLSGTRFMLQMRLKEEFSKLKDIKQKDTLIDNLTSDYQ